MKRPVRLTALALSLALVLLGAAGCGDIAAKVEVAENPVPAGLYEDVSPSSHVSLDEKANYAWNIEGEAFDAVTNADTEYYLDGEAVSLSAFDDAAGNTGVYEGDNEDSFDDTYDFVVIPDGVISQINLVMGD